MYPFKTKESLSCCAHGACNECEYQSYKKQGADKCIRRLTSDALKIIQRQDELLQYKRQRRKYES